MDTDEHRLNSRGTLTFWVKSALDANSSSSLSMSIRVAYLDILVGKRSPSPRPSPPRRGGAATAENIRMFSSASEELSNAAKTTNRSDGSIAVPLLGERARVRADHRSSTTMKDVPPFVCIRGSTAFLDTSLIQPDVALEPDGLSGFRKTRIGWNENRQRRSALRAFVIQSASHL